MCVRVCVCADSKPCQVLLLVRDVANPSSDGPHFPKFWFCVSHRVRDSHKPNPGLGAKCSQPEVGSLRLVFALVPPHGLVCWPLLGGRSLPAIRKRCPYPHVQLPHAHVQLPHASLSLIMLTMRTGRNQESTSEAVNCWYRTAL